MMQRIEFEKRFGVPIVFDASADSDRCPGPG